MTFLQPFLLWALPLFLAPLIIHLLNRLRYRSVQWGAVMFIMKASRSSTSMAKLRQFLILLFRMLAVLILIIALARPLAGGWLGWTLSGPPDTIVILLDRSATMGGKYKDGSVKLKEALKLFEDAIGKLSKKPAIVFIDSASMKAQNIPSADVLSLIPSASPTGTAADMPELFRKALSYLAENQTGVTEIWIASDMQRSNWQPKSAAWEDIDTKFRALPQKTRFRLLAMDQQYKDNLSISITDLVRKNDGTSCEVFFEIRGNSVEDKEIPLLLWEKDISKPLKVSMNGRIVKSSVLVSMNGDDWKSGMLKLPPDSNLLDNTCFFAFAKQPKLETLIISSDSYSGQLFEIASAPYKDKGIAVSKQLSRTNFAKAGLTKVSLIIWQGAFPIDKNAEKLRNFVKSGGTLIFFPPENENANKLFGEYSWGKKETSAKGKSYKIAEWQHRKNPLEDTASGWELPLTELTVYSRRTLSGNAAPLASFTDDKAFLSRVKFGKGSMYFCSTLPEPSWSELNRGTVLLPMLQRMLWEGSEKMSPIHRELCGKFEFKSPEADIVSVYSKGNKFSSWNGGVYRDNGDIFVLNRPPEEDLPGSLDGEESKELFTSLDVSIFQDRNEGNGELQAEIWHQLLIVILLLLLSEAFLCLPERTVKAGGAK